MHLIDKIHLHLSAEAWRCPPRSGRPDGCPHVHFDARRSRLAFRVRRQTLRFSCQWPPEKWLMASEQFRHSPFFLLFAPLLAL